MSKFTHKLSLAFLTVIGLMALASAQTADSYWGYSFGAGRMYGFAVTEGSMSTSQCPPAGCLTYPTHTYYAKVTFQGPSGHGATDGTYSTQVSGYTAGSIRADDSIVVTNGLGDIYTFNIQDWVSCTVRGIFFNVGGLHQINVDLELAIQQNGLSNVITNAYPNTDGTYTLQMSPNDYADLYAAYQDSSDCICTAVGTALHNAAVNFIVNVVIPMDITILQKLGVLQAERTPVKGAPNSHQNFPSKNGPTKGQVVRVYGRDGNATHDIDYGDQAHSQWDPEVHDWTWSGGQPQRQPARQPVPGDFPSGVPTTWPWP